MTLFLKRWNTVIILCIIIMVGAYLRLAHFGDLARFNADQVRDTQIVLDMINKQNFPLLGPKAGGTTFQLGPAFYYLQYLSGKIFGATPSGIALIVPLLSILSIPLLFSFVKKYFPTRIALTLTFLYATSFYAIRYTRFAWNPNLIPFFILAYLITLFKILENKKHLWLWYILTGIIMGISIQLHTTLLILMPTLFIVAHIYLYVQTKQLHIIKFATTIFISILLLWPMIAYDMQNNGKNTKAFFQGTQTKTEDSTSIVKKLALTTQFFIQGDLYVLTSIEPRKDWININKLLELEKYSEIILSIISTLIFFFSVLLLIKYTKKENSTQKNAFLFLVTSSFFISFLLFFLIAEELNLRFFIILIFLPFILFGLILHEFLTRYPNSLLTKTLIITSVISITALNLHSYNKTYNFNDLTTKESVYGGISIGELEKISQFIDTNAQKNNFILPFDYARSVKFFAKNNGIDIKSIKLEDVKKNMSIFLITKNKKGLALPKEYENCFTVTNKNQLQRFTVFYIQNHCAIH